MVVEQTDSQNWFSFSLESISKLLLGIPVFCYALGLVVLNLHLWQYGYFSPSLVRLNYVAAGAWALCVPFLVVLALSPSILAIRYGLQEMKKTGRKSVLVLHFVVAVLLAPLLLLVFLTILRTYLLVRIGNHWWASLFWAYFLVFGVVMSFDLLRKLPTNSLAVGAHKLALLLVIGLFYVHAFATVSYHTIPAAIGGGMPQEVHLLFERDAKTEMTLIGIPFNEDSALTRPLSLLLVTDEEFVVLTIPPFPQSKYSENPPYRAVSISRRLIKAAFYEVQPSPGFPDSSKEGHD